MNGYVTKDSGGRESFASGMVRDLRSGKGRYDLITPFGLKRLADVYERGAQKYDDRNWEKGAPYCRFIDSAMRHIQQWLMGEADEDHLAQAAWNLFAIMHLEETHPELDDRPCRGEVINGLLVEYEPPCHTMRDIADCGSCLMRAECASEWLG